MMLVIALSLPPKVGTTFNSHKLHPAPIISWPLISSLTTNMDLCHSRPDVDMVFSVETIRLDVKNFFDEDALPMILKFSKE